jgi:hypothetical protein
LCGIALQAADLVLAPASARTRIVSPDLHADSILRASGIVSEDLKRSG